MRVLATSDVHMHLTGWNALQERMAGGIGLDQLAPTIHAARADAPGLCLLFDNGDMLQGTPEGDLCAEAGSKMRHPWPDVAAALGYDAVGLGNHDFDYGLDALEAVIADMPCPVLCASLSKGHIRGLLPSVVLNREVTDQNGTQRPISIGITSVLPPQTLIWNHSSLHGRLAFATGVEATRRAVAALRKNGADLVVLLCHSGLSTSTDPGAENFAAQIGAHVSGVDAMIMGHTHRLFPPEGVNVGTVANVPAVMPGFAAQMLGQIDLDLAWGDTGWQVTGHQSQLRKSAQDHADPVITDLAAPGISATRARMSTPLTTTEHHIHSYFNCLQSGTISALMARAMTRTIKDHVAGSALADRPLIAAVASPAAGGLGGAMNFVDIPKGTVHARHAAMTCPYPNQIWAATLSGAALRDWAERAAAYFAPKDTPLSPLVNPDAPAFGFDTLVGVETEFDPFSPPRFNVSGDLLDRNASRVRALRFNGLDVAPDDQFLVAMSSYRGAGGNNYPGLGNVDDLLCTDVDMSAAVRDVLKAGALGDRPAPSAWRFAKGLHAQVVIETSPKAADHLDDIARFDPYPLGLNADGFLRLRVTI